MNLMAPIEVSQRLTTAQLEVLRLLVSGLGRKEVAHRLGVSESAVKARVDAARRKLGAKTTIQVIGMAYEQGQLKREWRLRDEA